MTQDQALEILKMGQNVFLTGPAGSGKTYLLNKYIKYLKEILGLGGYSEDKRSLHMEDYDLWLKVGAIGKFANLDMVTTDYLQKKGGLASQARKLNLLKFHIRALKKYWNVYNGKMLALFRMAKTLISAILK